MVFSSTIFLFAFFPAILIGYHLIRPELKNAFLLIMSLIFYAVGEPVFVWVMMASIVANYLLGILADRSRESSWWIRKSCLFFILAVNLGLLFYYKYFDFFIKNVNVVTGMSIPLRHIILPIGISFFTFQGLSYVLDVYTGKANVQKNLLNVALYIALFPQLIAGPIVRYTDINEEINHRTESLDDFASGAQRFTVGLAKKIILSNNFALLADRAFGMPQNELEVGLAWMGAFAYTLQIYFDFSGYSDMAIGLGRMVGFHFLENFNYPYISTNITSFWRRWHISLSSWFRDYVYIPLGGNRRGNVYLHLLTVFFLTGLWHGASWNFIVWGMWHGTFLIAERILRNQNVSIQAPVCLKWVYTMLVVVIGWVFFRAVDLSSALAYVHCMLGANGFDITAFTYLLEEYGVAFIIGVIAMLPVVPKLRCICCHHATLERVYQFSEPVVFAVLLLLGISVTVTSTYNPFIYFNF